MKVGIFGGTFNPIHLAHLVLAETAREQCQLDRVLFIPAGTPPHKSPKDLAPGLVRLSMVQAAIANHPAFGATDAEIQRDGRSYSVDTLRALRQRLPEAKLFLLVGLDMLGVRWKNWDEIRKLCTVVVAGRPGMRARRQPGVKMLKMPLLEISSTDIRRRLAAGRSIRYLVPPAVERLIQKHGLYSK